jgi:hypothetical protein
MAEKCQCVLLGLSQRTEAVMCLCKGESTAKLALVYGVRGQQCKT